MNNIDYTAVIEIINNFLNNEKVEIYGISYGEENQLRKAIENLLKERQADKDRIKELENKYIDPSKARLSYNNGKYDVVIDGFIPKSLVKEKMKELILKGNYRSEENPKGRVHFMKEETDYQIEILQELLEGGE